MGKDEKRNQSRMGKAKISAGKNYKVKKNPVYK